MRDRHMCVHEHFETKSLVENTGIEPVVPEGGGFTVHCITIDASSPMVLVLLTHYLLDLNTLYSSLRFIDLVT